MRSIHAFKELEAWNSRLASFFNKYKRFLIPVAIVFAAKIVGALFLFNYLQMGSSESYWMTVTWGADRQNAVLISLADQGVRWPFPFLGWDGSWYLCITAKGYAFFDQSYALFPGLPLFSWLLNFALHDSELSLIVVSSIAGVLWIPAFQVVAETYSDLRTSQKATVFYAFFPYVFLFTTVAYAESLFMLFTLLAWYFFRKRATLPSMLCLSLAVLSRPPGLLLMLPILAIIGYSQARLGKEKLGLKRNFVYLSFPFVSFFIWLLYAKLTIGEWFAIGTRTEWAGMPSLFNYLFQIIPAQGFAPLAQEMLIRWPYSLAWLPFLFALPVLLYFSIKLDKALALYSGVFLFAVLLGGALASIPRFISFIFPLWLALGVTLFRSEKSKLIVPVLVVLSYLVSLLLWLGFLQGQFVA